jgi:hypothetical protein
VDVTGYYHLGLRDYDPVSGQWLSYDPMWNAGDPNGQSFCAGDPINGFDPNGKCSENAPQSVTMTTPTPLPIFNSDQPPNLFGVQPLNGSSLSPSLENQNAFGFNYETASATLNVGGIAQFGGEFGSGAASIGINNASGEISLYTHFYGNQSTTAYMFSDIAHYGGYPLAVASVYLDYRNPSVSRTQFGINTGVAGIGIFGGPVGASFSVAYGAGSLVQEGVNGAAAGSFQYLTDLYYNAPLGPNYADMPDEP